jgi:hypothetical protein
MTSIFQKGSTEVLEENGVRAMFVVVGVGDVKCSTKSKLVSNA